MVQHKVAIIGEPDTSAEFAKLVRSEERYTVRFFSFSKDDVEWLSQGLGSSAVLAVIGDSEDEQSKVISSLCEAAYLKEHALLVCSNLGSEKLAQLQTTFSSSTFLPLDVEKKDLLAALKEATEVAEPELGERGKQIVAIFDSDHFFTELVKQDLGGAILSNAPRKEKILGSGYLPENSEVVEIFSALEAELPTWAQARIHRMAYVNHKIFSALRLTREDIDLREASVLGSWALCHNGRGDAHRDLTNPQSKEYRTELGDHLGETADEVLWELEREAASAVIRTVGLLVKGSPVQKDSKSYYPAAVILATDMVDRIVWQWDLWNPLAARKLVRALMVGEFEDFPPYIICAVLKMVLEAIETVPASFCIAPEVIDKADFQGTEESSADVPLPEGQKATSIAYLKPGVRLARDVYTYDGVLAVEGGIVLDADMVWRIWSLASTRSLRNPPVVYARQGEQIPPPTSLPGPQTLAVEAKSIEELIGGDTVSESEAPN